MVSLPRILFIKYFHKEIRLAFLPQISSSFRNDFCGCEQNETGVWFHMFYMKERVALGVYV